MLRAIRWYSKSFQARAGPETIRLPSLFAGDGVAFTDKKNVAVQAAIPSEVLLFDLA